MKICHVNFAKGFRGGERQTQLLIEALAELGLEQMMVARHDSPLHEKLATVKNLISIPVKKPYFMGLKRIQPYAPALIHAHDAKAAQWALLNYFWKKTPYVMTRRMSRPSKNRAYTKAVYRHAARVVALSTAVREGVHFRVAGIDVDIIPSMFASLPVDPQKTAELAQRYADYFVIGHIGALVNPHKGQAVLIKSIRELNRKHKNLKVLLLGVGKDEALLRRLAYDLENVEFIGFVEDVGNWISVFDLFVFPSLEEGLGSSLLDVMQQAKPIVASRVGGICDVIQHRENGLLVPPNDPIELARAIEEMITAPDLRKRLGKAGLATLDKYSPSRIARCYYDIYNSVLS